MSVTDETTTAAQLTMKLAPQKISTDVLVEKYCKGSETTDLEIFKRVAKGVASVEKTEELRVFWEQMFLKNMVNGAFGAGRIMAAAGTEIQSTLINCFLQPVEDSVSEDVDGYPGIYEALKEAAETMRRGGGVGYDFSRIRPRNAHVKGTHSHASGPCSYIDIFDASGKTVESAGGRRGANLAALRIDHPDIEEYITAKRTEGRWNGFNVSVAVTDPFMVALENDGDWDLVHKAKPSIDMMDGGIKQNSDGLWVYKTVKARDLWEKIMQSNYEYAEPGVLFIDRINQNNNLNYIETIESTNPCGEQPLPPYGCCDLGPIDLTRFIENPFTNTAKFNIEGFKVAVAVMVRFLDNVLEATYWPLEKQHAEAMNKRRIGVGFTGLGNALAMMNVCYDSDEGRSLAESFSKAMMETAYLTSVDLAIEKGVFPALNVDSYLADGTFASRLPKWLKHRIRNDGIRNSHLLSIAPVGTVSLAFCDNASNGVEPPYSLAYTRKKRNGDGTWTQYNVLDHGFRVWLSTINQVPAIEIENAVCSGRKTVQVFGEVLTIKDILPRSLITALEITGENHIRLMAGVQKYVDSSVSKTVNVAVDYPYEDFKKLYTMAYDLGVKGLSTYRPNSILGSVLSEIEIKTEETTSVPVVEKPVDDTATVIDKFLNTFIEKRGNCRYPAICEQVSYIGVDGEVSFYVTVSFKSMVVGVGKAAVNVMRPIDVFLTAPSNDIPAEWVNVFGRDLSLLARSGIKVFCKALGNYRKVTSDKGRIRYDWFTKPDGTRVPRYHGSDIALVGYVIQEILKTKNVLDEHGTVTTAWEPVGVSTTVSSIEAGQSATKEDGRTEIEDSQPNIIHGKKCDDCGAHAVIKKDGCSFCTNCGVVGSCG